MYETFFDLSVRPFDLTPNPKYLFLTPSHREALSNLEYGIASRKGITLLVGEAEGDDTLALLIRRDVGARDLVAGHRVHLEQLALIVEAPAAQVSVPASAARGGASAALASAALASEACAVRAALVVGSAEPRAPPWIERQGQG